MSDVVIRVEGLGKQYHIGGPQKSYDRLGEQLVDMVKSPFRRTSKLLRGQATGATELDETIWALQDVSFEIKPGEVVGIIGRNGAGKSTLLKILSEITEPTEGYADIYGRVGSLLEVGTGFHPELTGRENIYLNGAILGMKKTEIEHKFDEIVAFAEIDKFIDTPVKHYSSGMYVRLAFAVAAHLEPEILLVDEVLAVGDIAFQKKCLGKMDDIAQQGRTVLFVSHNMGLMQQLCQRGIFLQQGTIAVDGSMTEAVNTYLQTLEQMAPRDLAERTDRRGVGQVRLIKVEISNGTYASLSILKTGEPAHFVFHVTGKVPNMSCVFGFHDGQGRDITWLDSRVHGPEDTLDSNLGLKFVCEMDQLLIWPGRYSIDVRIIGDNVLQDHIEGAVFIDVADGQVDGRPESYREGGGGVCLPHRWILPT
ncbi:MAG: ABC transporter ATP-binding protein [Anaerolineae bacterium]|nr:ABC transporter ATP-binding protein [Anaerolineae bacterium]